MPSSSSKLPREQASGLGCRCLVKLVWGMVNRRRLTASSLASCRGPSLVFLPLLSRRFRRFPTDPGL